MKNAAYLTVITALFLSPIPAKSIPVENIQNLSIAQAYEDSDGHLFIEFKKESLISNENPNPKFIGMHVNFYGDSRGLWQLFNEDEIGDKLNHVIIFRDSHLKLNEGQIVMGWNQKNSKKEDIYELRCADKKSQLKALSKQRIEQLLLDIRNERIPLNPLPYDRIPRYLYKLKNADYYVFADSPKFHFDSKINARLFAGSLGQLQEKILTLLDFNREGGLGFYQTKDFEELFVPSPLKPEQKATWNNKELEKIDLKTFDLSTLGIAELPFIETPLKTPCEYFSWE